jgi:hypothetical protein
MRSVAVRKALLSSMAQRYVARLVEFLVEQSLTFT